DPAVLAQRGFPATPAPRALVRTRGCGEGELRRDCGPPGRGLSPPAGTGGFRETGARTAGNTRHRGALPARRSLARRGSGRADRRMPAVRAPAALPGGDAAELPATAFDRPGLRAVAALHAPGRGPHVCAHGAAATGGR